MFGSCATPLIIPNEEMNNMTRRAKCLGECIGQTIMKLDEEKGINIINSCRRQCYDGALNMQS